MIRNEKTVFGLNGNIGVTLRHIILLSTFVTDADIKAEHRTNYSMIILTLTFGKETKNELLWKFNNYLLKDKLYADEINAVIKKTTKKKKKTTVVEGHTALPYSQEQLPSIPKYDHQFVISDQLLLDVLLMRIRSKTISYATMKKKQKNNNNNNNVWMKREKKTLKAVFRLLKPRLL